MAIDLAQIDTAALDGPTRATLERQVHAALAAATTQESPHVGADLLEYELAVDMDGSPTLARAPEGTEAAVKIRELASRISDVK